MAEVKAVKKSYIEQLADIEEMTKQAETTRREELEPVITKMKADIKAFRITADQLGFFPPEPLPAAPTPPKKNKAASTGVKQPPIERDEDGNRKIYLKDGSRKPFFYYNPENKQKAYEDGKPPAWLKALKDSKADPSTYTIKQA